MDRWIVEMETQPATSLSPPALVAGLGVVYALSAWPAISGGQLPMTIVAVSVPLGAILITLSSIDLRTGRLPDILTLPLMITGPIIALAFGWQDPVWHVVAAAVGFGAFYAIAEIYCRVRKRDGLGFGDAKLFGAAGAWLGVQGLPSVLLWATGTALAGICVAVLFRHRVEAATAIPFGPFLALGFWLVWLYGPLV